MTQEELDALMAGELDDILDEETKKDEHVIEEKEELDIKENKKSNFAENENYRVHASESWPPPPPTDDHKMVLQLDDVTKDSEKKATEVFDKLESINGFLMDAESLANEIKETLEFNLDLFSKLNSKFPNVNAFDEALSKNEQLNEKLDVIVSDLQMGQDDIMMTMDMMQYQDIHRQKIERVINVMRALSRYMNTLFEARIDDDKRVGSAVHIEGDTTTEDVVSNEDIEALIESLGNKQ